MQRILDARGLQQVTILVNGDLDEYALRDILASAAPVDVFGIGTRVERSRDMPYLDCAYKLQEHAGQARRKRSEAKQTWPGCKQIYRNPDTRSRMAWNVVILEAYAGPGQPLLMPVMRGGCRPATAPALEDTQRHAAACLAQLPEPLHGLVGSPEYRVKIAPALHELAAQVDRSALSWHRN